MKLKDAEMKTYPRPIRDKILVARNASEYKGRIAIPEKYKGFVTSDCLVLDKGKGVDPEINIGDIVLHNKESEGHEMWIDKDDPTIQIIRSEQVFAVLSMNTIKPIGNVVVIERFNVDTRSSGIILPNTSLAQNLYGRFVSRGVPNKKCKTITSELKFGDKIKIAKWDESHHEVRLGKSYYVIIPDNHVEFKLEDDGR